MACLAVRVVASRVFLNVRLEISAQHSTAHKPKPKPKPSTLFLACEVKLVEIERERSFFHMVALQSPTVVKD
jgi:hypothetical protein